MSLRMLTIWPLAGILSSCGGQVLFSRNTPVRTEFATIATAELPQKWRLFSDVYDRPHAVLMELQEDTKYDWGGQSHPRGLLWIALLASDATLDDAAKAAAETLNRGREHTSRPAWLEEKGSGGRQSRIGEAVYESNSLKEPVWILQRVDLERGIAFTLRGWKKKYKREALAETADRLVATLEWKDTRAAYFAEVRDRPRKAQVKNQAQMELINGFLTSRGVPPATAPDRWLEHDGLLYKYSPDERWPWFFVLQKLGERKLSKPAFGVYPPVDLAPPPQQMHWPGLTWYVFQEGRWGWEGDILGGYEKERMERGQNDREKAYFWYGRALHLHQTDDPVAVLREYFELSDRLRKAIPTAPETPRP